MLHLIRKHFVLISFVVSMLFLSLIWLERVPPLGWDEGWNMSVARNWVEMGHYGLMRNGELSSDGLAGHYPVIASIALSFRLFGVGIWQGRLPGVLYTYGTLVLLFYLASRTYNYKVAVGTMSVVFLMMMGRFMHPILIGRQAIGEMPTMFFLLSGFVLLLAALDGRKWMILAAMLAWGIAINAKAQVLPFWVASIVMAMAIALYKNWWRQAILILLTGVGAWFCSSLVLEATRMIIGGNTLAGESLVGLYGVTALVYNQSIRAETLRIAFIVGLPTIIGMSVAAKNTYENLRNTQINVSVELLRIALLALAASWFAWYAFSSIGWTRYFFPPVFIGSIFTSALLYSLTNQFNFKETIGNITGLFLHRKINRESIGAWLALILIAMTVPLTVISMPIYFTMGADSSVLEVTDFINNNTPRNALIESYDSELFIFLERRYHYPPDQISVELMRRTEFEKEMSINYDALASDPDYLVVGSASRGWGLYDSILNEGSFKLLRTFQQYQVYERVRE